MPQVIQGQGGAIKAIFPDEQAAAALEAARLQAQTQQNIARMQEAGELKRARIGAAAQTFPARLQQQRFRRVFPWVKQQFGSFMGGATGPFTAGGQSGQSPEITVGPIWTPQQIQEQVNALRASNAQQAQGQFQQMQQRLSGRGFGSNSPLLQALGAQIQGQRLAADTTGERELRFGAAEKGAEHLLKTQQAREQQFASRMAEDIERRRPYFQTLNTLLASIAGLV